MFEEAAKVGGLDVQLAYYRGFGECRASRWVSQPKALRDLMTTIDCRGGHTQIGRILAHARKETGRKKVNVLVFVGDAMEEKIDDLAATAGELGMLGPQRLHLPGRARSRRSSAPSARSLGSPAAPMRVSTSMPPASWPSSCARRRSMPPAA